MRVNPSRLRRCQHRAEQVVLHAMVERDRVRPAFNVYSSRHRIYCVYGLHCRIRLHLGQGGVLRAPLATQIKVAHRSRSAVVRVAVFLGSRLSSSRPPRQGRSLPVASRVIGYAGSVTWWPLTWDQRLRGRRERTSLPAPRPRARSPFRGWDCGPGGSGPTRRAPGRAIRDGRTGAGCAGGAG